MFEELEVNVAREIAPEAARVLEQAAIEALEAVRTKPVVQPVIDAVESVLPVTPIEPNCHVLEAAERPDLPLSPNNARSRVYIDLDETLVNNNRYPSGKHTPNICIEGRNSLLTVRSDADTFLQTLRNEGHEIFIHTSGETAYQQEVVKQAGLLHLVDGVIGKDAEVVHHSGPWVLIDDLQPHISGVYDKFEQIGVVPKAESIFDERRKRLLVDYSDLVSSHYLQCPGFNADYPETAPGLMDLLPKIQELLKTK